jgi:hypothetical protein
MKKLFELENENGEKIYFDNIEDVGEYIVGFGGFQSQFTLSGRTDTASDFEIMAERKYTEDFTRVYSRFYFLVNATNPSAETLCKLDYIFTDFRC